MHTEGRKGWASDPQCSTALSQGKALQAELWQPGAVSQGGELLPQPTPSTAYRSDGCGVRTARGSWESCLTPCAGLQEKPALLISPSSHPGCSRALVRMGAPWQNRTAQHPELQGTAGIMGCIPRLNTLLPCHLLVFQHRMDGLPGLLSVGNV